MQGTKRRQGRAGRRARFRRVRDLYHWSTHTRRQLRRRRVSRDVGDLLLPADIASASRSGRCRAPVKHSDHTGFFRHNSRCADAPRSSFLLQQHDAAAAGSDTCRGRGACSECRATAARSSVRAVGSGA
ncbi:hypothetical protein HPB50_026584 [Hyalomma asiaticum]|uniref:Uncharacterized protein n=1 Tax=Hyalomma asiaticum TaxID=266040 RepID=A0ACB7SYH4_HYAAI|nr:hypothetical protein HPB50_026584 [Hyalomma asiaticum]